MKEGNDKLAYEKLQSELQSIIQKILIHYHNFKSIFSMVIIFFFNIYLQFLG